MKIYWSDVHLEGKCADCRHSKWDTVKGNAMRQCGHDPLPGRYSHELRTGSIFVILMCELFSERAEK